MSLHTLSMDENQSEIIQIGILQKLFERDYTEKRKDGNIGHQNTMLFKELGVGNMNDRVSEKVNFLALYIANQIDKYSLYHSLKEVGHCG